MNIGGLQKFSLLDYPEYISAIIFTQGCNFRCGFCHNPMLVWPIKVDNFKNTLNNTGIEEDHCLLENDLFSFLRSRVGKLDGVVITGGEPTIYSDLPIFIKKIKKLGFKVKLDTNGTNFEMLNSLIKNNLIDYIAMDIKAPEHKYEKVIGVKSNFQNVLKSIKIIIGSKLSYEFRTTIVPDLIYKKDIEKIGELIKGAKKWYLQKFNPNTNLLNKEFENKKSYTHKEMQEMQEIGKKYTKQCKVR